MHRINPEKLQFANLATRTYPMNMDTLNSLTPDEIDRMNRFTHHTPSSEKVIEAHQKIREECLKLSSYIAHYVPDSREKSLALTKLEEVMFWSNAGIARHQNASE